MIEGVLLVLFPALMAFAAASDFVTMTIPNKLSLALMVGFVVLALVSGMPWSNMIMHLLAGSLVLAVGFVMFAFRWIGGGDAKLAAVTALWFGFAPLLDYVLLSSIAGGALTLLILAMRTLPLPGFALGWGWLVRLHDRNAGVPYGIALAGAAMLVYPKTPIPVTLLANI